MSMRRHTSPLECKQCGHAWFRELSVRTTQTLPMRCPSKSCRSRHWNTEYTRPTEIDRFLSFVEITDTCWWWRGSVNRAGYGRFRMDGSGATMVSPHRYSYLRLVGMVPVGHHIHHICQNRACVKPAHLKPILIHDHQRHHPR